MKDQMGLHNSNKTPFFEGYYYKVTTDDFALAIIVGFTLQENKQIAFVQCYNSKTNQKDYLEYDYDQFYFDVLSNTVYLKDHYFGKDEVYFFDERVDYVIHFFIDERVELDTNFYTPTIMGPFHYIPFLQCNHAIITLQGSVEGEIIYKDACHDFSGIGYSEKDWGTSFPREYVWIQSNHSLEGYGNSLFLACGHIPMKLFDFMGVIGLIKAKDKTYKIGSYFGAKVIERSIVDQSSILIIKQGKYLFSFKLRLGTTCEFLGPNQGVMNTKINESLDSNCTVKIYKYGKLKQDISFLKCGMEIVDFMK